VTPACAADWPWVATVSILILVLTTPAWLPRILQGRRDAELAELVMDFIDTLDRREAPDPRYDVAVSLLAGPLPDGVVERIARKVADPDDPSRRRLLPVLACQAGGRAALLAIARDAADPLAREAWSALSGRPEREWAKAYAGSDGGRDEAAFVPAESEWEGWWTYPGSDERHPMTLRLVDAGGRITARGTDEVGPFTFEGRSESGQVVLVKRYATHEVAYRGRRTTGGALVGHWRISASWSGDFELRPARGASTRSA
jgi:hypothetical protein